MFYYTISLLNYKMSHELLLFTFQNTAFNAFGKLGNNNLNGPL